MDIWSITLIPKEVHREYVNDCNKPISLVNYSLKFLTYGQNDPSEPTNKLKQLKLNPYQTSLLWKKNQT